ncbi:MAG TPA: XdhC family protein [bacterium]|nr:XdhC family protein [bacterium]HOL47375.1 XdhC family protein [bacterium]HPQ18892.1 XdhC family protein [bacterium]
MNNFESYKKIIEQIKNNDEVYLFISFEKNNLFKLGSKILLDKNFNILFSELENINKINFKNIEFAKEKTGKQKIKIGEQTINFYVEKFQVPYRIIIFGAGHICLALCNLLQFFDFNILVVDDRIDLLEKLNFPKVKKLNIEFTEINNNIQINENDFLVIITRGHIYDKEVLEQVVNSNAKYIGMIGSKKRVIAVKKLLSEQGVSEEKLNQIYAPIGLPISNNQVEEIALSILSQIIAVKNNKINFVRFVYEKFNKSF